ncbi:MAG: efflux RND transporter periplasmic adaptor subunit [Phycisphaeraceae bacterium]
MPHLRLIGWCVCLVTLGGLSLNEGEVVEAGPRSAGDPDRLSRYEGFTEPSRELVVESYLDGVLETLHVKAGDSFEKDSTLVSLDDGVQALAVEVARLRSESRAEVQIAEARVLEAEIELESQESLARNGSATERDVRRARAELSVARAELDLAKENRRLAAKQLEIEQERLTLYTITAPFDGEVLALARQDGAEEGAALQQNDRIMHIAQLDPIVARISLPTDVVRRLDLDQAYPLRIGDHQKPIAARVTQIASQADRGSQLIEVSFKVDNTDGALRSGLRCKLVDLSPVGELTQR